MTNRVIEIVTFNLAPGVTEAEFLEKIPTSTNFIKACEGFISRRLSRSEDGSWLEHVEWETMAAAKAASDAFMSEASLKSFMQAIDGSSAKVRHNQLLVSVG
ncbi:MAG: antibiotic biosynthesis monooxygenase family protein [Alphaproteobacteria bacterium]